MFYVVLFIDIYVNNKMEFKTNIKTMLIMENK